MFFNLLLLNIYFPLGDDSFPTYYPNPSDKLYCNANPPPPRSCNKQDFGHADIVHLVPGNECHRFAWNEMKMRLLNYISLGR